METKPKDSTNIDATNLDTESIIKKTVEDNLTSLYKLQLIYSKIDKIRVIRGELPLEVNDLEDACSGINIRIDKFKDMINDFQAQIEEKQQIMKKANALILRYKEQLENIKNNREFEALTKEIDYQNLEIQLSEKKIKEFNIKITEKQEEIGNLENEYNIFKQELEQKETELNTIIAETKKEETLLLDKIKQLEESIEPRLVNAFMRIRNSMRNGLSVVKIERDACAGCFSKISPQRQLDIRMHKKIIVCEFCGRILVDDEIASISEDLLKDIL